MYNVTETWTPGTTAAYLAQCQPGYCGMSTTLSCDPTTGRLSGSYPICTPMNLPVGQQALPIRAQAPGVNNINVSCVAGFMPDPSVTTTAWASGSCTLSTSSSVVSMPSASSFACIPSGRAVVPLMQPVDPQWWVTSNAFWTTSLQGASVIQMTSSGGFDGGLAFFTPVQINMNPGFAVQFDVSFRVSGAPADGILLNIHNDPRGTFAPTCPIGRGGCNGFNCNRACGNAVNRNMYLYAPKTWNNNLATNYLSTGAFLAGSNPSSTNAGNVITSIPALNDGDVLTWNVNYTLATGVLAWSVSRTAGLAGTQSWTQTIGDLRPILGASTGWLGFSGSTGGSWAAHQVNNVRIFPQCSNR